MIFALCDDDKKVIDFLSDAIYNRYGDFIEVVKFTSARKMMKSFAEKQMPDAILTDICIGDENGIQIMKKHNDMVSNIPVIFITSHFEYCQDIFLGFNPWGLLTKPIDKEKLYYHIDKIIQRFDYNNLTINISFYGRKQRLHNSEIIYIESNGRKVIYHTKSHSYEEYIKLDDALLKLKVGFLRCHKSYAVNINYIKEISDTKVFLNNLHTIPISRTYKNAVKTAFFEFTSEKKKNA